MSLSAVSEVKQQQNKKKPPNQPNKKNHEFTMSLFPFLPSPVLSIYEALISQLYKLHEQIHCNGALDKTQTKIGLYICSQIYIGLHITII